MKTCTKCKIHDGTFSDNNCVKFFGNKNADIVFITESVNPYDVKHGIPFSGDMKDIFDDLLKRANINKDSVAVMSAIRCYKSVNVITEKDIDTCFFYTLQELKIIKPKLVVALGDLAFYAVSGKPKKDYKNYKNKLIYSDKIKCNVFSTHKLQSVLYERRNLEALRKVFRELSTIVNTKPKKIEWFDYKYVDNINDFDDSLFTDLLFFDIESTGLRYLKDTLTILQISNGSDIVVFNESVLQKIDLREFFKDKRLIGQDFSFDMKFLCHTYNADIDNPNWYWDTCLAEYIISGMMDNDLTSLVWKYCPEHGGYDDYVKSKGGAHLVDDPEELHRYGAADVGVLPKIMKKQEKMLVKLDKIDLYRTITMPTNRILTKASLRGVKYNVEYLKGLDEVYKRKQEKLFFKIENMYGIRQTENKFQKKFNPRSSLHVKHLLLDIYQLPELARTKPTKSAPLGNIKCSKDEMEIYAKEPYENKYCQIMQKNGTYGILRSTFLGGVLQHLTDDVSHTKYSIHSTNSGRPNSKDNNLLNIPRQEDIKKCLISRDGRSFVYSDEGQLEVRIAAVVYNDPKLIALCNDTSKDFHCNMTANAFSRDYEEIYHGYTVLEDKKITELRVAGKSVTFGVIYQTGADGLSKQIKKSKSVAQKFIDDFYIKFPDLKKNIEYTKNLVVKQGFVDNYFGFRRSWQFHTKDDHGTQREAVNHMVQSLAWNLIQLAMIQINDEFIKNKMESYIIMQIYDAVIAESPDDEVREASKIIKKIMEGVNKPYAGINKVVLVSDVDVGKNLGEMKRIQVS